MQQYLIMSPNMWREKNQNLGTLPARDLPRLARVQLALLRPPRRPPLAPRLRQREHAGPEGGIRGRLPRVVGVDALLLQALPRVALERPSRGVVARRPLVRPLLARPEQPHAAGPLLPQLQRGKRPAARCGRPSTGSGLASTRLIAAYSKAYPLHYNEWISVWPETRSAPFLDEHLDLG
jgi:hypothetical protein